MTPAGPAPMPAGLRDLVGLDRGAFADAIAELDARPFRARQLWHWVYERGVTDFAAMSNLPAALRAELPARFRVGRPAVARAQVSEDGTRKWLLRLDDGNLVETVFIPEEDRAALCISSQVGCTLTCAFCHTGTQKLVRNLSAGEIAGQVMLARDELADWPSAREGRTITNIVLMGMGEPLYNYENVAQALRLLMDDEGIAISKRRITLSTSGVVPMIERVGAELDVNLAISLHAPTDDVRDILVPINRKHPIAALMAALRAYPGLSNARRITFEYVMLDGVNDSPADARALAKLIAGIPAKFNLIPFNPWPGTDYATSPMERIERFAEILNAAGFAAPIRMPRGRDILAACGQLKSESLRAPRRAAPPAPHEPAAAAP